jgi:death-on-curing protein
MRNIRFLTVARIIEVHDEQIKLFGGAHGTRDKGLLESAVMAPQAAFGDEYLCGDIFSMAATYAVGIIKNHAFVDGNKRTGITCAISFLRFNKITLSLTQEQFFDIAIAVATSKMSVDHLAELFREHAVKE